MFGSAAVSMETMITIWNLEPGWETYLVTFRFNQMSQVWGQAGLGSPRSEGLSLKIRKIPHPVWVLEITDYNFTFLVSSDNYLAPGLPLADELQTTAKIIYTTLTAAQQ